MKVGLELLAIVNVDGSEQCQLDRAPNLEPAQSLVDVLSHADLDRSASVAALNKIDEHPAPTGHQVGTTRYLGIG